MTIDQQFVEYIIKSLVGNPDQVRVDRTVDEKGVLLTLTVAQEDLGRVIGKKGTTAQSIRTLLRALGTKNDARYNLKIVDVNGPSNDTSEQPKSESHDEDSSSSDQVSTADSTTQSDDVQADNSSESDDSTDDGSNDPDSVVSKTRKELEELDDLDI